MELAKVRVYGKNQKPRHYLRVGRFEKDSRSKLKRFTVKDQASFKRPKAPRMNLPILHDELLAKFNMEYLKFYEKKIRQIIG